MSGAIQAVVGIEGGGAEDTFLQIEDALKELGVEAHRRPPDPLRPPPDDAPGEATGPIEGDSIELPLAVFVSVSLAPFFHALLSKAGEDAYAALKKLVRKAVTVEVDEAAAEAAQLRGGQGQVTFKDSTAPMYVELDLRLPDTALKQLVEIDWDRLIEIEGSSGQALAARWYPPQQYWRIVGAKYWVPGYGYRAPPRDDSSHDDDEP
jgi:hypothetical protein